MLDVIRATGILTGLLRGYDGVTVEEYVDMAEIVVGESERLFCPFMETLIKNGVGEFAWWYRVVKSAEIAIPRMYLCLLMYRVDTNSNGCERRSLDLATNLQDVLKTVNDPLKGLVLHYHFLRFFQKSQAKEKMEILLNEFGVSNRMWIRLGSSLGEMDLFVRQCHRIEQIVAFSIRILAKLETITNDVYSKSILPMVLQHLIACRDETAQEFFMELLLDEFPIEYHQRTVEQLFDAVSRFDTAIDIRRLISAIVNKVLKEANDGSGFEDLWTRVAGLLREEGRAIGQEEAVLLCSPLLHQAMAIRPFKAERVESILAIFKELHTLEKEREAIANVSSRSLANVFDVVIEFVPSANYLFDMPSLFDILSMIDLNSVASCALTMIDRLVKDGVYISSAEDDDQAKKLKLAILMELVRLVVTNTEIEVADEELATKVHLFKLLAENVIDRLVFASNAVKDDGFLFCHEIITNFADTSTGGARLALMIFIEKLAISWIVAKGDPEKLLELLKVCRGKLSCPPTFTIPRVKLVDQGVDVEPLLGYFASDAHLLVMVECYAQCVAGCVSSVSPSSSPSEMAATRKHVYQALVGILTVFEEEVTESHTQLEILRTTSQLLIQSGLEQADTSLLLSRVVGHGKKLLKVEDRIEVLFGALDTLTQLGGKIDIDVVEVLIKALVPLLPSDIKNEDALQLHATFDGYLLTVLINMGADSITHGINQIAYNQLKRLENYVAIHPISTFALRDAVDTILADWNQLCLNTETRLHLEVEKLIMLEDDMMEQHVSIDAESNLNSSLFTCLNQSSASDLKPNESSNSTAFSTFLPETGDF